jgi:hypothetical protein
MRRGPIVGAPSAIRLRLLLYEQPVFVPQSRHV